MLATSLMLLTASTSPAQPVTVLSDNQPLLDAREASLMWIDNSGTLTVEDLAARGAPAGLDNKNKNQPRPVMQPSKAGTTYMLGEKAALWQHYRFARQAGSAPSWVMEFPLPLLDRATVFQLSPAGVWTSESAGDTLSTNLWPEQGRYAQFRLQLPDSGVHEVYVRIQHLTDISLPINVVSGKLQTQRQLVQYLMEGVVFGVLVSLIVACAAQSWAYRDLSYAWYAVYALIMMLFIAAWAGVAGHLLWSDMGRWPDIAPGFLGILCGGAALLVGEHLFGVGSRQRWLSPIHFWLGVAALPCALLYAWLPRSIGVRLIGVYLVSAVLLGIFNAFIAWRRKDPVGLWVLTAFLPLALTALVTVMRVLGQVPSSELTHYGLMVAMAAQVPLLLVALNIRSRERHEMASREKALSSQDALTGLLAAHIFDDRLQQVCSRTMRFREPAAVVFIELVNYHYIRKTWGIAVAEQSLLRSVIKLRRILHDVNTVGRINEARFGLILEGVSSREVVTALCARLIAAGLMPLKGLKPEVVLQFHAAGVLLSERYASGAETTAQLNDLLSSMAGRTRRPIRFLEPELTRPMSLQAGLEESEPQMPEETSSYPQRQAF